MKGCTECQLFHVTHGNATASTEAWSQIPRTGILFLKHLDKLTSLIQHQVFVLFFNASFTKEFFKVIFFNGLLS